MSLLQLNTTTNTLNNLSSFSTNCKETNSFNAKASFIPTSTPLDNYFQNLNEAGIVAVHWHHFKTFSTIDKKETSLFLFEKKANVKATARFGKINRLGLLDLLRYDIGQLAQLAHPRILRVLHPLTENKEMIAFACEPIYMALDCLLKQHKLEEIEIKLGVLQIIEGLSYLHNGAKILHGNLTPSAIFVTSQQLWKIGNFSFSVVSKKANSYPCFPWTKRLPYCLQPELDFLAPEYLNPNNQAVTTAADVFSLGILICWIYTGGKKLIDVNNNLESYQIVIDQLDIALGLLTKELGCNLQQLLSKVLSKKIDQRPAVQLLALTKHFDDPTLSVLRQLDDIFQEFDPANKALFLEQVLVAALPNISESLWFNRVLQRFNENFLDSVDLYPMLLCPLIYILNNCATENIYKLRPWFQLILDNAQEKALSQAIVENMASIFRRLDDEKIKTRCFDLLIFLLLGEDIHLKQLVLRTIPNIVNFLSFSFISQQLIPTIGLMKEYFNENALRQMDLLKAIEHLSDRCDVETIHNLLKLSSLCNTLHPAVVHLKSRLVQKILICDVSRLKDPEIISHHLLNPLILGLVVPELTASHFDDVMSSARILLDIIEQLRYESDKLKQNTENERRFYNRRVSMSSNHLPRLLVTAAKPSFSGNGRKMSFLSADGRLEDRSQRESKDSRCLIESDTSLRIDNGSDVSVDSALNANSSNSQDSRRKTWLDSYINSTSFKNSSEHKNLIFEKNFRKSVMSDYCKKSSRSSNNSTLSISNNSNLKSHSVCNYTPSDSIDVLSLNDVGNSSQKQTRSPTTFTNLGHNLACTLWKTFH